MGVSVMAYAKLNLTLDITGQSGGYHMLDSLVTTIDLADEITLAKRDDSQIIVCMHGMGSESIPPEHNNAVKAAKLFCKTFGTLGVDISIEKHIPMGAGLGGSSADVAGVLRGLALLYGVRDEDGLKQLADSLGSDCGYLLTGGFARMTGRGEQVQTLACELPLFFLLLTLPSGVSTPACYRLYDELPKGTKPTTEQAIKALHKGSVPELGASLGNALYPAAVQLNKDVERSVKETCALHPDGVNMTGSGSCVFAMFADEERCQNAMRDYQGKANILTARAIKPTVKSV
jgi:4-diphosphocytidyl-2-C-methyl-D-erythritol kinase